MLLNILAENSLNSSERDLEEFEIYNFKSYQIYDSLYYTDQFMNVVLGNGFSLLWESYESQKYNHTMWKYRVNQC